MDEVCDYIVKQVDVDVENEVSEYIMQSYDDAISIQKIDIDSNISSIVNYIIAVLNIHFGEHIEYVSTSDGDLNAYVAFVYKNRKYIIEDYYSSRGYSYWVVRMFPVSI